MKHQKLLSKCFVIQRYSWVFFTMMVFATSQIMSQPSNNPYRIINSKTAPPETFKFISPKTCIVDVPGAAWIQIVFGRYNLNKSGKVTIYDEDNGELHTFNQNELNSSSGRSERYTSSRLRISATRDVLFYEIDQIPVGVRGVIDLSICGDDERVPSNDARVGRIMPRGCTGWIIGDNTFLTAGHCVKPDMKILEFNVPASYPDETTKPSEVQDQYAILENTTVYSNGSHGNDWAVFRVARNTETGLLPLQAQGAQFYLSNGLEPNNLTVTGYGEDDDTSNQTQQTNTGSSMGIFTYASDDAIIKHIVDTRHGNSGSPVFSADGNQQAIGIHVDGGEDNECYPEDPDWFNVGCSFRNDDLWQTITDFLQVQVHYWPIQNGIRQGGINIHSPVNSTYWIIKGSGDVNGDGTDDIIWQDKDGQVYYWPMSNGIRQEELNIYTPVSVEWTLKGIGDVNGDGTDDIIWQHTNGQVHYWRMSNGVRQEELCIDTADSDDWKLKGIGDVNGDGTDDIIWQHKNEGQVTYWFMSNGVKQSVENISTPVNNEWNLVGSGDVNGDSTDDIIWQYKTGLVHYWSMNNGIKQDTQNIHDRPVNQDWVLKAIGDVNGDGTDDILWLNISALGTGDVNYSDIVDIVDAYKVGRYMSDLESFSNEQQQRADVNGDGHVSIHDAQFISCYYVGLLPSLPADYLKVGDVNSDGTIDTTDVNRVEEYLSNPAVLDDVQETLADVDGNESITSNDKDLIHQYHQNEINEFPYTKK